MYVHVIEKKFFYIALYWKTFNSHSYLNQFNFHCWFIATHGYYICQRGIISKWIMYHTVTWNNTGMYNQDNQNKPLEYEQPTIGIKYLMEWVNLRCQNNNWTADQKNEHYNKFTYNPHLKVLITQYITHV